jgi:alpha-3'-ketoglucosidase
MKLFNILLSFVLVLGLATSCGSKGKKAGQETAGTEQAAPAADEGWTVLFDGTSTAGWRGYNKPAFPEKGWEIVDGTLHCIGSGAGEAGGAGGDIIYDKKFSNFELSLEWKISEGGNSGIFILGQEIPGTPIYESAPEMQILDNERHPDAKLGTNGNRMAGSLYDLIPANPQNTKPVGEWNQVGIICYQGTVVFKQNGANVVEFHLWTDAWKQMVANSKFKDWPMFVNPAKEGYIGLQDHGNDVWFRNIKIKEM